VRDVAAVSLSKNSYEGTEGQSDAQTHAHTQAVVILFEAIKKKAMKLAMTAGKDAAGLIKCDPKIEMGVDGVEFDLNLSVNLEEYEGLSTEEIINKLLPGPAKLVYKAVLDMINHAKDKMIPDFKELAEKVRSSCQEAALSLDSACPEGTMLPCCPRALPTALSYSSHSSLAPTPTPVQVEELIASTDEVFDDPVSKITEAFGEGGDMFAIPKAAASAAANAKTVRLHAMLPCAMPFCPALQALQPFCALSAALFAAMCTALLGPR
jgi:hypothetical protein